MKPIVLIFISAFVVLGCNNDDETQIQDNNIIGTWKLIEVYENDGGVGEWTNVENGFTYTFKNEGSFTSTRFPECSFGTYMISESTLSLVFGCEDFSAGIESPEGTFIESYTFEGGKLYLSPKYLSCDEGCSYKFAKVE